MKKYYKVTFEDKINGEWVKDYFSNGGRGYSYNEALEIKEGIERDGLDGLPFRDLKIEEMAPRAYRYGMRLRGFSIGCQPTEGFLERQDDPSGQYWDIITYNRPLTELELEHFSLDHINK